jgi:hypothetical protein
MPDLSPEVCAALKVDIFANGVQIPVDVDEHDNILDGFHRWQICEELGIECPKRVLTGLTEAQKREHAYRMNLHRRHLSKTQKIDIAGKLWQEAWVQDDIAKALGCSQPTASRWIDQFIQTHKPTQPVPPRRSKNGKPYPARRASKSAKRQPEGTDTAERGLTSPPPSGTPAGNSIDTRTDAEQAEGMPQQDATSASHVESDGPASGDIGVEPEAAAPSDAAPSGNSPTPAAASETAASPMDSVPASGVASAGAQSWVRNLEALSAQVQALQVQGGGLYLSAQWHPQIRAQCLDIIRCLKEVFTKWEEMIEHKNGEAVSTDGHDDGGISAGADHPASRAHEHPKRDHPRPKTSKTHIPNQFELFGSDSSLGPGPCSESL